MDLKKAKLSSKWLISLLAGICTSFSLIHHLDDFWKLSLIKQILVLIIALLILKVVFSFLFHLMWKHLKMIDRRRWLLFLIPAGIVASFLTWATFKNPNVRHQLEIIPIPSVNAAPIQLLEIKSSNGGRVDFSTIKNSPGWVVKDGVLIAAAKTAEPLKLSFSGPAGRPARLTFLTGPQSGSVKIILDGKESEFDLANSSKGPRIVEMNTRFLFGIPGGMFIGFLIVVDFLALMILLVLIWLVQEIPQRHGDSLRSSGWDISWSHKNALWVLLSLSFLFHLINYFSVPLFLSEDSPTYLQGAVHWLQYHNFEGVSPFRGPVSSIFFLVPMLIFGRNPWGTKLFLHLFALLIVPLSYYLGWQLSRKQWFATLVGLVTIFTPDLYEYANFIMSEIPNIVLVLLFCIALLSALETLSVKGIIATMLMASLTVLLRSENIILLYIGMISLAATVFLQWFAQRSPSPRSKLNTRNTLIKLGWILFATLLAAVPILGWSAHNYKYHGFFGLSNYGGEVLYTGWVYEGEASHVPITDKASPAVQIIQEAYGNHSESGQTSTVPTGWEIHPFLVQRGYSDLKAFDILKQAALDSIKKNYRVTMEVLWIKIKDSFTPAPIVLQSIPLSNESSKANLLNLEYFNEEKPIVPFFILVQRRIDRLWGWYFAHIYPVWAWFCVIATALCFYRKPFMAWGPIVLITLTRVLLPNLIGLSHWRPVVSGIVLMQICALACLHSIVIFFLKPSSLETV